MIGTPASISASVEPQTEPIDDEPFDSSVSETIRIVYGKSSAGGQDRLERPLGERAVADVAALGASHEARLPDRVRREVVVVHEAAIRLEREIVDPLALLRRAERQQAQNLRLPALEEARAVRPRRDRDLAVDLADLLGAAAVGPPLVDRDLLADEILVDRLGGLLDVALGQAVLDLRGAAVRGGRADRERQLDAVDDPLEEKVALGRLQLLRVLLGIGESSQVVLELLAHRTLDGHEALLLEQHREARAGLQLPLDVRLGRLHRRRAGDLGQELVGDGSALAKAVLLDPLPDRVPVGRLDLGGEVGVEPLRLAGLGAQILLRVTELADLGMGELERLEQQLVGNLVGAGLDHRQAVLRADDDQVERRDLVVLLVGRVEDPLVVDPPDAHALRPGRRTAAARASGPPRPR